MKLDELQSTMNRLNRARRVLEYLDETTAFEVEPMAGDGYFGTSAKIDDPAMVETIKAHIREKHGKTISEATALLTAHGIDIGPEEEGEDEEQEEAA
jgi:hypothetical protein